MSVERDNPSNDIETGQVETCLPTSNVVPNNSIELVQNYLAGHYLFRYNDITNRIEYKKVGFEGKFEYLKDYQFNSILREIKTQNIPCSKENLMMILKSDFVPLHNPFQNFLDNLPIWDGVDYISILTESVSTTQPEHFKKCLKKWLVALVAGIAYDERFNHTALIFSGRQGIGKTTWFHSILPLEFQEFIHEGYILTKDKETNVKIAECVLIIMDELENLSDKSMDSIKQLITQKGTLMRRAYSSISQYYKRIASFAGTVNKKHFLRDMTGNRRFLCFEVLDINLNHGINHQQLFAQIKKELDTGFHYWFDEDEIKELEKYNEEFRDISAEEEAFFNLFEKCDKEDEEAEILTTTEIVNIISQKTNYKKITSQSMGHVLRELNLLRRNNQYGRKGYVLKQKK